MSTPDAATRSGVELLERSLAWARLALDGVHDAEAGLPTPCGAWCLADLLVHMVDSLEVVAELGLGRVAGSGPPPSSRRPEVLADHLRVLGCVLLGHWTAETGENPVQVGPASLDRVVAAEIAGLEIAVHGWDVAACRGRGDLIPSRLAAALLPVALARVPAAGRAGRFAPPLRPSSSDPASLLLAHLGRDVRWPHVPDSPP